MIECKISSKRHSEFSSFPLDLLLFGEFKSSLEFIIKYLNLDEIYKPKVHSHLIFLLVKLYAEVTDESIEQASQCLNDRCKQILNQSEDFKELIYKDGKRKRRYIPHQTEIDDYFSRLTERNVKMLFGGLLDRINQYIFKYIAKDRSWSGIVDNKKDPYYGNMDPTKHIKSPHLPGTKVAWFFQGISVVSKNIHLYTDFDSITKGVYRCLKIPENVRWLQFIGESIERMLVDREFYRAAFVRDMRQIGVHVLMPTKKFKWVRHRMERFLEGKSPFMSGTIFSQSFKQYPYQKNAAVRLVLIGHNEHTPWEVREKYLADFYTFDEAMDKLAGFYTTLQPWKNKKQWVRWLIKQYKKRWNIETGFSKLNELHISSRDRRFERKLANLYIRGIFYNIWQASRLEPISNHINPSKIALTMFKKCISNNLEEFIIDNIVNQVKS